VTPPSATHAADGAELSRAASLDGSNGESALVVEHLTKRFGDRVAFDDLSFSVGYGEVFGFLGPNGAGKTTAVRTLGTLVAPTSGSAIVAGIPLSANNGSAIRSRISMMPESPGLYLRLTVTENLLCFAGLYELRDVQGRIERALGAVNLEDRARDKCGSLSKGLRQRVALAPALLNDPAVLFLDEPTSGVDPVATREVHKLIASLPERGVTIFLTTHRLEQAEWLRDRVAILKTTLWLIGHPDEVREQLFRRSLDVGLRSPLGDPKAVFGAMPEIECWDQTPSGYTLTVSGPDPGGSGPRASTRRSRGRHPLPRRVSPSTGGRLPRTDRRGRGGQGPETFSWTRVGAILRKELRDYRHNRFVIGTMAATPVLFIILPTIQLIAANATGKALSLRIGLSLLYMLVIPVTMPSVMSAYSVVGERNQGTLEPVLATPIRREEFLIAKALAAFAPTLIIAYAVFGIFLAVAGLFAHPAIVAAIYAGPHVLVQLLFTPLLAGWAMLIIVALMSLNVISESTALAIGLAAALLAFDLLAWRVVARMFDRERFVVGGLG